MKSIIIFIALLLTGTSLSGQKTVNPTSTPKLSKVKGLPNDFEVEEFLSSFDPHYKGFKIKDYKEINVSKNNYKNENQKYQRVADSLGVQSYVEADFDKNGLLDVMVIGASERSRFSAFVVLSEGNNNYNVKRLHNFECAFPVIKFENDIPIIDCYRLESSDYYRSKEKVQKKSLIYKFNDFIEYNEKVENHKIEKIEYSTTLCFGSCPVFDMIIEADKAAFFTAKAYNYKEEGKIGEIKGDFKTVIDDKHYEKIVSLLNYIDFENLRDNYSVGVTCQPSCTLQIYYDNGKVKKIRDYGKRGTKELAKVYKLISDLRYNQKWE